MVFLILLLGLNLHFTPAVQTNFVLIGSIRDTAGQAVSNVRISVSDENMAPVRTILIDSSGRFKIPGLRVGAYTIRIETTGTPYEEQTQRIELQSGRRGRSSEEMYPIDFVLRFKKSHDPRARSGSVFAQTVPEAARNEYDRGVKSLKANKTDQALSSFKKAIEIFPDYFDALELLGVEQVKASQYEVGVSTLNHALRLNKRSVKSLYGLGVAHLNLNHLAEAIEQLEAASQLDANNPNTFMMLGLAYGNSKSFEKAENSFKKALQLGGADAAESHFYLAGLYNKQGKYRQARQELELFLKQSKTLKDPSQIKGMIEKLKEREKTQGASEQAPADAASATNNQTAPPQQTNSHVENADSTQNTSLASVNAGETRPTTDAPAEPKPPEPEPIPPLPAEYVDLIRQSESSGAEMHKRLLSYTYTLKKTRRVLDERGNPSQSQEQIFEAYPVKGEHVLIRRSTNGQPSRTLAEDRNHAIQQLKEAEAAQAADTASSNGNNGGGAGYLSAGVSGVYNGKLGYVSINVAAFLQNSIFFSPEIETIEQRPTVVLNFRPRVGVSVPNNFAYVNRLMGKIWIDQADRVVTRIEAWPVSAFDLISSMATNKEAVMTYQQERQINGLWFPTLIRMNARGRAEIFNGLNWDVVFEFSDYQRFDTSSSEQINTPPVKNN